MAEQGSDRPARKRPPAWRVAAVSLAAAALTLWAFSGWTWWVLAVLVGGLILARLVLGLFPEQWRQWASNWAVVLLAAAVALWLVTWTSTLELGVAVGVAGAATAVQLPSQRSWMRWAAAGVSVSLAAGCGLALWLAWRADEERREASERQDRAYRVADMRPDTPLEMFHQLAKDLAGGDEFWVCWLFDDSGRQQFTAAARADSCEAAVRELHGRIESGRRVSTAARPCRPTPSSRPRTAPCSWTAARSTPWTGSTASPYRDRNSDS